MYEWYVSIAIVLLINVYTLKKSRHVYMHAHVCHLLQMLKHMDKPILVKDREIYM